MSMRAALGGACRVVQRRLLHGQPATPSPYTREYFYVVDQHGQLFLADTKVKNFTSCTSRAPSCLARRRGGREGEGRRGVERTRKDGGEGRREGQRDARGRGTRREIVREGGAQAALAARPCAPTRSQSRLPAFPDLLLLLFSPCP